METVLTVGAYKSLFSFIEEIKRILIMKAKLFSYIVNKIPYNYSQNKLVKNFFKKSIIILDVHVYNKQVEQHAVYNLRRT